MVKFVVGDLVRFRSDIRLGRRDKIYVVEAVSDIYGMLRLRNRQNGFVISWYPMSDVTRVSFYQPELTAKGV